MPGFREIEGAFVVLTTKGVYKPVPIYERNGFLWAKSSGGYIKLMSNGSSSKDGVRIDELSLDDPLYQTQLGYLAVKPLPKAVPLEDKKREKLQNLLEITDESST